MPNPTRDELKQAAEHCVKGDCTRCPFEQEKGNPCDTWFARALLSAFEREDDVCIWDRSFDGHFNIDCADKTNQRANGKWRNASQCDGQTWQFVYCPYCGRRIVDAAIKAAEEGKG